VRISHSHTTTDEGPASRQELPSVERPVVERIDSAFVIPSERTIEVPTPANAQTVDVVGAIGRLSHSTVSAMRNPDAEHQDRALQSMRADVRQAFASVS
jgi:hypothetical protein